MVNMRTWRWLPLEIHDGYMNMAIDEAIVTSRASKLVPNTLRFYQWKPSAVSIGRNQNPQEQVYIDALKKFGFDLVRRTSGGGTVYHDQTGELTYSVTARMRDIGKDVKEIYSNICESINDALRLLGISADFSSGNQKNCPNLMVKGRKISGNAQTIRHGIIQQHGTILLKVDFPLMFQLLRVPFTEDCSLAAQIAQRKITSIENELGHKVSARTVQNALLQGFENILKIQLKKGFLTQYEQALVLKLDEEKYSKSDWNNTGRLNLSQSAT